jgi:hypothetical protein
LHGQQERLLDVDPPGTGPHLNGAGPGVEVEGPRGVAVAAVRGGGGVATGATTAAGSVVIAPLPSAPHLSQVVVVGGRRPSEVVAQHTEGRRSSPGRRHSRGRVGRQTPRV